MRFRRPALYGHRWTGALGDLLGHSGGVEREGEGSRSYASYGEVDSRVI